MLKFSFLLCLFSVCSPNATAIVQTTDGSTLKMASDLHGFAMASNLPGELFSASDSTSGGIKDGFKISTTQNWRGQTILRVNFWNGKEIYRRTIPRNTQFLAVISAQGDILTFWQKRARETGALEVLQLGSPRFMDMSLSGTLLGRWNSDKPFIPGIKGYQIFYHDSELGPTGILIAKSSRWDVDLTTAIPSGVESVYRRSTHWKDLGLRLGLGSCATRLQ